MAEVRVPFSATAELLPPFMLDETYTEPNGVKSVLFDKSELKVIARPEFVEIPDIGPVQIYIYSIVGAIPYICNAFPITQAENIGEVIEQTSIFNDQESNKAPDRVAASDNAALGWISASGRVIVDIQVGGAANLGVMPSVQSVCVEDLAVANNPETGLLPVGEESGKTKRIIKWRGYFVITTT